MSLRIWRRFVRLTNAVCGMPKVRDARGWAPRGGREAGGAIKYVRRRASVLTGRANLEHLHTLKRFPVFMGCVKQRPDKDVLADMGFSICRETGVIQLDRLLPLELVYLGQHNDGVGAVWEAHYRAFVRFLGRFRPRRVLEIGGAGGTVAKLYTRAHGRAAWTIVEPNPTFAGTRRIAVVKGWFDDRFRHDQPVDAIVHSHVFEHTYDPPLFLRHVAAALPVGGRHIFSLPNMVEQLRRKYTNCLNFEHTVFLAENIVDWLLESAGFRLLRKDYFQDHSIFYATEWTGVPHARALRSRYRTYRRLYLEFVRYHERLVARLNRAVLSFRGPVYLFGAHIFSQYLLGFGLRERRLAAVLDNSPLKIGRRLYGSSLNVQPPRVIAGRSPVGVILKVGAYRDEVWRQLRQLNPRVTIFE